MLRNWPTGLMISFSCLGLLLGGLLFWMFSVQTQYQNQERETYQERRDGIMASGRNMIEVQETLMKDQAREALISGDPHKLLLGWIDPYKKEIVVFAPAPDFQVVSEDKTASENPERWRPALKSQTIFPSGLPKRLVATVELAHSNIQLTKEETALWRGNMKALWHNSDGLDLLKLHTLIMALPDASRSAFFIHISLIRKTYDIGLTEGVFVEYGSRTGMMRFSTGQWEAARSGFKKMGLHMEQATIIDGPALALMDEGPELKRKHSRERLFFFAGSILLILVLVVMFWVTRTLIHTHRNRQMLLHAVSHEFRTPLSAILQFSEMLVDKRYANQEKADAYLKQIHQNGLRLQGLLENVLTMARIEKRIFVVKPEPVEIDEFLMELEKELVMAGGVLASHLTVRMDHEPAMALFDRDALLKAIRNLLENAAKYGAPPFTVHSQCRDGEWLLQVQDHGPGLAPEVEHNLCQPYTRKLRDNSDGTGLGLHLVKTIIDAHHGQIQFSSSSEGLQVTLRIPLAVQSVNG